MIKSWSFFIGCTLFLSSGLGYWVQGIDQGKRGHHPPLLRNPALHVGRGKVWSPSSANQSEYFIETAKG